ncbi:alpha/beta hydrolase [Rhodovulum euryhalinum]|uniref:Alpha/beta hydrolase family protein DUF900 n=1 Tax=Rhodovulum euryhalinum TaxID=35805 RepID=A0A4R2KJY1_9RHOB|nr:alpha/beta hydrolase [Rhodovulum euryhalinum]TCO72842.1 alpha/beta hydrolase family protein DUF900 [Rhodovulum euryhalinum]
MPLIRVNADADRLQPFPGEPPLGERLAAALGTLPAAAPVTVLIHGFRFSPKVPELTPHRHILALDPDTGGWKAVSWPRALGFSGASDAEGLCIAFGWESDGTIWGAYDEAARAGAALAGLIAGIRAHRPGRAVDLVAHSLGARVALAAMTGLAAGAVGHAVLMAPAEFAPGARAALDSPAGRRARILNVTSRENDPYDLMLEALVGPVRGGGAALGRGLEDGPVSWLDLQIDHPETMTALARMGHRIAPPTRRVCHWSPYVRPGMMGLYRALIRGELPFEMLRAGLPQAQTPRWSRLLAPPRLTLPLPFAGNAPS